MEKLSLQAIQPTETLKRSIVKTVTYRAAIIILDFFCLYLFTGQIKAAIWFTIISNLYTSLGYFIHERVWDRIKWGRIVYKQV
jgi:uncharacterized membrane protein